MNLRQIETAEARQRLRHHIDRHVHALWCLDDVRHGDSITYASQNQTVVVYTGLAFAVVFAVADPPEEEMHRLVSACAAEGLLPEVFYGHLSQPAHAGLRGHFQFDQESQLLAMTTPSAPDFDTPDVIDLTADDMAEVTDLIQHAYPDNQFHPAMMAMGPYVGVRQDGQLVAVCGTQAWSRDQRVAIIGNAATHPAYRRKGLALQLGAALSRKLAPTTDRIGITVKTTNSPAIDACRQLGYTVACELVGAVCRRT